MSSRTKNIYILQYLIIFSCLTSQYNERVMLLQIKYLHVTVSSFNTLLATTWYLKLIQSSYTLQPDQSPKGRFIRLLESSNPSRGSPLSPECSPDSWVWCLSMFTTQPLCFQLWLPRLDTATHNPTAMLSSRTAYLPRNPRCLSKLIRHNSGVHIPPPSMASAQTSPLQPTSTNSSSNHLPWCPFKTSELDTLLFQNTGHRDHPSWHT